jgi:5-enolpyruvylshikimate-3-phosphate synthase
MRRTPDISQMIEHMPTVALDALKVGDTVVMSSTKGAVDNEFTAIVFLDNAGMLIRMATAQRSAEQGRLAAARCHKAAEWAWAVVWAAFDIGSIMQ